MPRRRGRRDPAGPVTLETVRRLALALPEAEEGTSYGTLAFKVRGKMFVRLHQGGDSLVGRIDEGERAMRGKADPETFYFTDHYLDHPLMLGLFASVDADVLADLLRESWRRCAPARLLDAHGHA